MDTELSVFPKKKNRRRNTANGNTVNVVLPVCDGVVEPIRFSRFNELYAQSGPLDLHWTKPFLRGTPSDCEYNLKCEFIMPLYLNTILDTEKKKMRLFQRQFDVLRRQIRVLRRLVRRGRGSRNGSHGLHRHAGGQYRIATVPPHHLIPDPTVPYRTLPYRIATVTCATNKRLLGKNHRPQRGPTLC